VQLTYKKVTFATQIFNVGQANPTVVLSLGYSFWRESEENDEQLLLCDIENQLPDSCVTQAWRSTCRIWFDPRRSYLRELVGQSTILLNGDGG
jgi:hypothetical protein